MFLRDSEVLILTDHGRMTDFSKLTFNSRCHLVNESYLEFLIIFVIKSEEVEWCVDILCVDNMRRRILVHNLLLLCYEANN